MRRHRNMIIALVVVLGLVTAGCGSSKEGSKGSDKGDSSGVTLAPGKTGTPVAVEVGEKAGDQFYLTASPASVAAGPVTFTVKNVGKKKHEMVVLKTDTAFDQMKVGSDHRVSEDASVGEAGDVPAGETKSVTLDLKPGSYILVCNIEKHYEEGMRAAFTVTA